MEECSLLPPSEAHSLLVQPRAICLGDGAIVVNSVRQHQLIVKMTPTVMTTGLPDLGNPFSDYVN